MGAVGNDQGCWLLQGWCWRCWCRLEMVKGIIHERDMRRKEVVADVGGKWGKEQTIAGSRKGPSPIAAMLLMTAAFHSH